ncbi:hypothetical protein [Bradyrhizobium sp. NAS96.2]|uniref:hypothetical protein n=1 Tax=Bradyrhizobium sp. NAS96.2 TaxID=1680160 RepID=UPI000939432D|nr:hypothetical protein [Bradyrhizobium sp. NAS96.2]OKO73037.1 hypothetical protein AC628_25275 [Bradyrhizobium sp. NAS96.2]
MTDDIAALIRDFDAAVASIGVIGERLRALQARASTAAEPQSGANLDDLVRPGTILQKFAISRAELHRRCRDHPIGTPGGFSLWRSGKKSYLISLSRFERHFAEHPPLKRRPETKKRNSETR